MMLLANARQYIKHHHIPEQMAPGPMQPIAADHTQGILHRQTSELELHELDQARKSKRGKSKDAQA
jgi:hypothetical protein